MMILLDFLETFISAYTIGKLGKVKHNVLFISLVGTTIFIVEIISNQLDSNFLPLSLVLLMFWYIGLCLFKKSDYIYNFIVVLLNNGIVALSLVLPVIVLYRYNFAIASLIGKLLQLIISRLFIKYTERYNHFSSKYWIDLFAIIIGCSVVIEYIMNLVINNSYYSSYVIIVAIMMLIIIISLFFFKLVDQTEKEKEKIFQDLQSKKYLNLTNDLVKHSVNDMKTLQHQLMYQMLLIKDSIEKNDKNESLKIINQCVDDIDKFNHFLYTGNYIFDRLISMKINEFNGKLTPMIAIPDDDLYSNPSLINLLLDTMNSLKKDEEISLIINDNNLLCIIEFRCINAFIDKNKYLKIVKKYDELLCFYNLDGSNEINKLIYKVNKYEMGKHG